MYRCKTDYCGNPATHILTIARYDKSFRCTQCTRLAGSVLSKAEADYDVWPLPKEDTCPSAPITAMPDKR